MYMIYRLRLQIKNNWLVKVWNIIGLHHQIENIYNILSLRGVVSSFLHINPFFDDLKKIKISDFHKAHFD